MTSYKELLTSLLKNSMISFQPFHFVTSFICNIEGKYQRIFFANQQAANAFSRCETCRCCTRLSSPSLSWSFFLSFVSFLEHFFISAFIIVRIYWHPSHASHSLLPPNKVSLSFSLSLPLSPYLWHLWNKMEGSDIIFEHISKHVCVWVCVCVNACLCVCVFVCVCVLSSCLRALDRWLLCVRGGCRC